MSQVSIKTIITRLETFATSHKQINQFGFGELYNISTKDLLYPYMHVMPVSTNKINSLSKLNLEIYIMDLERGDNLLDIMSNLYMVGNDIVTEFMESDEDYGFSINTENITTNPFTGKFDDLTAGWNWKVEVDFIQTNNSCTIPKK